MEMPETIMLDVDSWHDMGLSVIEDFQPEANYGLYLQQKTEAYQLWCIEKYTSEEHIHWGILFDKQENLLGYKVFAYDNSEGSLSIYTKIKGDEIRIYTENIYETEATQSFKPYMMTDEGFIN